MTPYDEIDVPVPGGCLRVVRWPGAGPVVVAAHGITSNALAWSQVAEHLAGAAVTLVAPDLRGRAGSRAAPPPYGIGTHADDLVAVLDALAVPSAVLAGHSMGAFVAAVAAARHPGRVSHVVLVDGGVGFPAPRGSDVDAVLEAVLGPAMRRLGMTFGSPEAYLDFWREHPALRAVWTPTVEAHLRRDLVEHDGGWRSSCVLDAVRIDGREVLEDTETLAAAPGLRVPATLLWAERGLLDEPQGLYDEARVDQAALPPVVRAVAVPDVNHYSIVLGSSGAEAVAEELVRVASDGDRGARTRAG